MLNFFWHNHFLYVSSVSHALTFWCYGAKPEIAYSGILGMCNLRNWAWELNWEVCPPVRFKHCYFEEHSFWAWLSGLTIYILWYYHSLLKVFFVYSLCLMYFLNHFWKWIIFSIPSQYPQYFGCILAGGAAGAINAL